LAACVARRGSRAAASMARSDRARRRVPAAHRLALYVRVARNRARGDLHRPGAQRARTGAAFAVRRLRAARRAPGLCLPHPGRRRARRALAAAPSGVGLERGRARAARAGARAMTLRVRVAQTTAELDAVFRLRHQVFVEEEGYMPPRPDRRIADRFDAYP